MRLVGRSYRRPPFHRRWRHAIVVIVVAEHLFDDVIPRRGMLAIPLDERRLREHGPFCCSQTHRIGKLAGRGPEKRDGKRKVRDWIWQCILCGAERAFPQGTPFAQARVVNELEAAAAFVERGGTELHPALAPYAPSRRAASVPDGEYDLADAFGAVLDEEGDAHETDVDKAGSDADAHDETDDPFGIRDDDHRLPYTLRRAKWTVRAQTAQHEQIEDIWFLLVTGLAWSTADRAGSESAAALVWEYRHAVAPNGGQLGPSTTAYWLARDEDQKPVRGLDKSLRSAVKSAAAVGWMHLSRLAYEEQQRREREERAKPRIEKDPARPYVTIVRRGIDRSPRRRGRR